MLMVVDILVSQNSLLPCDDVLGSVDDFIAGLVGLVSAIIMAAFRQKYINITNDIHFACMFSIMQTYLLCFKIVRMCGINGFNIKNKKNWSSENIK